MAHRIRAAGARSEEERHSGVLVILPGHERMKNRPPRGVAPTTELRRRLIITEIGDFGVAKRRDFRDLKKKEGERMSKLQDIYQRAYNNTPAATVDDNAVCIYRTKKGIVGTMEVSWTCYGEEDKSTVLYGSDGCLKINSDPRYPLILEKKTGERIFYDMNKYNAGVSGSGIIDTWISCLKTQTPPVISGDSSFESMKAVFAALESAQKGCLVEVENLEI